LNRLRLDRDPDVRDREPARASDPGRPRDADLREAVTSPDGTTIHAIRELERAGVRAAFLNAIQAAMERSRELADETS
jgi:pyrroline-5-carboxylate reductase